MISCEDNTFLVRLLEQLFIIRPTELSKARAILYQSAASIENLLANPIAKSLMLTGREVILLSAGAAAMIPVLRDRIGFILRDQWWSKKGEVSKASRSS